MLWINGQLLEVENAGVSPLDEGLAGYGVFETLRVYRGVPFAAGRHLDRLARSAAGMRMREPPTAVVRSAMYEVIAANDLVEGRIRVTVTGGLSSLGAEPAESHPTLIVAAAPLAPTPEATAVVTVPWPRNDRGALAGLKTTSYAENVIALAYAAERGAGEAVFANTSGSLCEGTGTNVFVGLGGRLLTPPLSSGCLPGVIRELLIELVDVAEEDMPLAALAAADEAFITSSIREVQAIRAVDGHTFPVVRGPLTRAASDALQALLARDLDP